MSLTDLPARTPVAARLARYVALTRLPFGGSVLVNGVTLALIELGERDAEAVDRLLRPTGSDALSGSSRLAEELVTAGWLVFEPDHDTLRRR